MKLIDDKYIYVRLEYSNSTQRLFYKSLLRYVAFYSENYVKRDIEMYEKILHS